MKTYIPHRIVEWIPYNNLQNVRYLTEGGCSKIYTADWVNGQYYKWDSKELQLKRCGMHKVILKKLENVESASRNWFDECKYHLNINNKWGNLKNKKVLHLFIVIFDILEGVKLFIFLAYHSMQQNLSIPSEIEDIISEQTEHQIEPNNSTAINDDKDNVNHNIKSKKIKLSNNKEFQYIQYIQKSYIANDDVEDDEITNNANLHSEDQENLEIPEGDY
ncbi:hypothetical protein RhiirA1_387668 [Rhizophagus irregularis]|uniref:Uncharacterized protein n=1 Tax=Rhizophagus irregularis TaxID=588596 RepID=A0A2N0SHI5_9GLOM|nr:hypothetical protein RhiirA1_387668 [Rhizophagus irregularis]